MTREATATCLARRTAHAMRAAAMRLARERAAQDADPSLAYGCVDWFRYDVTAPAQEVDGPSAPPLRPGAGRDGTPSAH